MSQVAEVLAANRAKNRSSLIGYFPAGYPTIADSLEACVAMCESGIDVLELGLPYSDPVMDGPVIQSATLEALEHGFKITQIFKLIEDIKARVNTPILVMSYYNPILQYGVDRFATELKAAGAAGIITPDLIPDEAGEWISVSDRLELDRVFLATPSSSQERVARAAELSRGFIYAVSTMGITGERKELDANARAVVAKIRDTHEDISACVGIGISTADQVQAVNAYADAAIVGSTFVKAYADGGIESLRASVSDLAAN